MTHPKRPGLDRLAHRMRTHRATGKRLADDGFIRETFVLPRLAAREKAREILDLYPRQAYWTEIESWSERADDEIEFTMRRLKTAD